jgi:hypothetical protein
MRTASYLGFFAMIAVGIGTFVVTDSWWLRVPLVLVALAIGWYSLGLYARAATAAAQRVRYFEATPDDEDLLREVGKGHANEEAFRCAREQDDKYKRP